MCVNMGACQGSHRGFLHKRQSSTLHLPAVDSRHPAKRIELEHEHRWPVQVACKKPTPAQNHNPPTRTLKRRRERSPSSRPPLELSGLAFVGGLHRRARYLLAWAAFLVAVAVAGARDSCRCPRCWCRLRCCRCSCCPKGHTRRFQLDPLLFVWLPWGWHRPPRAFYAPRAPAQYAARHTYRQQYLYVKHSGPFSAPAPVSALGFPSAARCQCAKPNQLARVASSVLSVQPTPLGSPFILHEAGRYGNQRSYAPTGCAG
jgi:hypothetical protein